MHFVGRTDELQALDRELSQVKESGHGKLVRMRGRRRVGKTRLIEEFLSRTDARSLFYQAPRRPPQQALDRFMAVLSGSTLFEDSQLPANTTVNSWHAAFQIACANASQENPIVIVLDELPYLVEHDPGFASDLQAIWDHQLSKQSVLLIAVGSDVRMMEALTSYPAELHGRPSLEIVVPPLSPYEVADLTEAPSAACALDRYLIVGGLPVLSEMWKAEMTMSDFLENALINSSSPLVTNAFRIMEAEFTQELPARQIFEAIGVGEVTFGRIAQRSGAASSRTVTHALQLLSEVKNLIEVRLPYAKPPSKKPKHYSIIDPYLRFWLRFIGPYLEELDRDRPDLMIHRIQRDWNTFRGIAIEPIVRKGLQRLLIDPQNAEQIPNASYIGSFWNRVSTVEVDIVAGDSAAPSCIGAVGSIKWREKNPFSRTDTEQLILHRAQVPGAQTAKLIGVSRSGFTENTGLDLELDADAILKTWKK